MTEPRQDTRMGEDKGAAARHKSNAQLMADPEARGALARKLLAHVDGPDSSFVSKLGARLRHHGVAIPSVTVEYSNLTVKTDAMVGSAGVSTVASVPWQFIKKVLGRSKLETMELKILDNLRGVLNPGRLTLLLGPPSCGKSTFLKVLAGHFNSDNTMTGEVKYNGHLGKEFELQRTTAFVHQMDDHNPNLSVRETLDFAFQCQANPQAPLFGGPSEELRAHRAARKGAAPPASAPDSPVLPPPPAAADTSGSSFGAEDGLPKHPAASSSALKGSGGGGGGGDDFEQLVQEVWGSGVKVDLIMMLLGLYHCRDTLVGDARTRGISGGEKKRLTTAELVVGPRTVLMMDEISTGLDSATLFNVIKFFKQATNALDLTMLVSLLQPPPEVFQLFDDVILMDVGRIVYHGPVEGAVPFFSTLGFVCPSRKDVPSFLLELTTPPGQQQYSSPEMRAFKPVGTRELMVSLDEMEQAFWLQCEHGIAMDKQLANPFNKADSHPAALSHQRFSLSPLRMMYLVTARQTKLMLRDPVLIKGRLVQVTVIALILGSLFYQLGTTFTTARTFFGACFMFTLFMSFGGFPQLPLTIEMKKVFFKHRDSRFYPAYAQGLAMALSQLPISVLECFFFSIIVYFMVGFYVGAGYWFTFYLILIVTSMCASALFRFLACASPNMVIANAVGGLCLVVLIITSGFAILRDDIPGWMIWVYWISPFGYSLRSLVVNEMTSPRWREAPNTVPGQTLGESVLLSFDFFTERYWIWAGVGALFGMYLLLTFLAGVVLEWLDPERPRATLPDAVEVDKARTEADTWRAQIAAQRSKRQPLQAKLQPLLADKLAPPSPRTAAVPAAIISDAGGPVAVSVVTPPVPPSAGGEPLSLMGGVVELVMTTSLPFTPITLVFKNIWYTVPNPMYDSKAAKAAKAGAGAAPAPVGAAAAVDVELGELPTQLSNMSRGESLPPADPGTSLAAMEHLELLKGITGSTEPGLLMALMGGSGAGKTTLMDVVAGRKTIGEVKGEIFVNGQPKDQRSWSRVMGYVEQTDVHTPAQTVTEALYFSAKLRLPASVRDAQVRATVVEVMDMVDMLDIQFNLVGTPGTSGLSVEQRKRLTIACELVANPAVVFMDEPTSGLDARAAAIVMGAVRNVARSGRSVMVTIHQPSIEIFEAFDTLMLIQRGGRVTYFGPLGEHSSNLVSYLEGVPGAPKLMAGYNPATWMLEVTGGSMATLVQAVEVDWPALFAASPLATAAVAHADALVAGDVKAQHNLQLHGEFAQTFWVQTCLLTSKFMTMYWLSPAYNFVRLAVTLVVAVLYGLTYYKQGLVSNPATIGSVQSVIGVMFSSSNFLGMTNCMSIMPIVLYERQVFYRERGSSMYNPFAYGLAIAVVEIPYLLAQACLFVPIMYFMVHFDPTAEKFWFYFIMFTETLAFYTIFGQFLVYCTPSAAFAMVLSGGLNFLFNAFNGFVITYPQIARGWKWMNRCTPSTWILYGLGVSQLGDQQEPMFYANQIDGTVATFMESYFAYKFDMRWWCVLIMGAYIVFMRVTSILALRYWNFLKR